MLFIAIFEDSLTVSYKIKHIPTYDAVTASLITQIIWKFMSTSKSAHNVYSSFIYNWENLEATKMFLSRWTDK